MSLDGCTNLFQAGDDVRGELGGGHGLLDENEVQSASSSGSSGSFVAAKRARMKSSPQHGSKNYMRYGTPPG